MRTIILTTLFALTLLCASAAERSTTMVFIDGKRYYVHRIETKQTLYTLAKLYGVEQNEIVESNPHIAQGLQSGIDIKIPYRDEPNEELSRSERRRFDEHTISAGETLYSISRRYAISIEVIINDNPTIDPIALSVGNVLLIRKREQGESDALKSRMEWERYRDNLNRVAPEGYKFHLVSQGETIYSLARRYEMSEAELDSLNNLDGAVKSGALITVVDKEWRAEQLSLHDIAQSEAEAAAKSTLTAKRESAPLRVAIFLPLKIEGAIRSEFAEFYNGFLLAVEDIKKQKPHRNITIELYNSGRDSSLVANIARSADFAGTELIIGPIYEECIAALLPYSRQNSTPIVSPLSQIRNLRSELLFQMAAMPEHRYDKIGELLANDKRVTFIHTDKTDSAFYKQVLSMVGDSTRVNNHTYKYEHEDVILKLLRTNENRVSPSDLSPFIANNEDNTIVITSNNQTDVDRVLAALASANTNVIARSRTKPIYQVLGNSAWSSYNSIDRSLFFTNGVVMFPSYEARRSCSEEIVAFDRRYILCFGKTPTLYSYRGYDAATIFINGAYSDIERRMQGSTYQPLQSQYIFIQDEATGVVRNASSIRVNYNKDFTITLQ